MNILARLSRTEKIIGSLIILGIVILGLVFFGGVERFLPGEGYEEVYTLVPDSLSTNAQVPISLPPGIAITPEEAQKAVTFTPALPGEWISSGATGKLVYQPEKALPLASTYTVSLALPDGKLEKAFRIEEDPKILAVFPKNDAEAPENSSISIVFNRPMVPLTSLDVLRNQNIPVTLSPKTAGSWKWISTRILQFVPETRLLRSQEYTVKTDKGFVSLDGLPVPQFSHTFTTRTLRYADEALLYEGASLGHSKPVPIRFNQPVDLEKTKASVEIARLDGTRVPAVLEYGTRTVYDAQESEEFIDKSVVWVYPAKDSHGRAQMWDADQSYSVNIRRAVPLEGNIALEEGRGVTVNIPSYIAGVSAESPRSDAVSLEVFDPAGTLVVSLFENINKDASSISAPGLSKIEYGEKCKEEDGDYYYYHSSDCAKVPDQSKLVLSFESARFSKNQEFTLEFKKLVNTDGITLNPKPITHTGRTYPELAIKKTYPSGGAGASVREMTVCSTTPLKSPKEEEFYTKIKANAQIGKWNWGRAFLVTDKKSPTILCEIGEFQNSIFYSLLPETSYSFSLDLQDDFGQTVSHKTSFATERLPSVYRRLGALQKQYNVTSPAKTKLTYAAENLEYVNLHVCQIAATTMLGYMQYSGMPDQSLPGESLPCFRSVTKKIDLPLKYWTQNYFQIDLKTVLGENAVGHYVVTLSHPDLRSERYDYETQRIIPGNPIYPHTFVTLTHLAVGEKKIDAYNREGAEGERLLDKTGGNLYWVSEIGSLKAVSGATVDVYQNNKTLTKATTALTNADGVARTSVIADPVGAIVTRGSDSAIVSDSYDKFSWAYGGSPAQRTYLYTDRPIYRPGQEVFFKGLTRLGYDGDYETWREDGASIQVFNSQGKSISRQELAISEYGTFNSSFKLGDDIPLGTYRIEGPRGSAYFSVEEYRPAAFKAEAQTTKEEYFAGDTVGFNVSADYYFGVPVEKGEVTYSIVAQDYYFDRFEDEYFNFGGDWYYSSYGGYGDTFVTRGKAFLDANGKTTISQAADFEKLFKDEAKNKSKIFVLRATVQNSSGQSISIEKSVIVHRGALYLGANLSDSYIGKGTETTIRVKTVDEKGKPRAVGAVDGEIYRITWDYYKRQEVDGRFYYTSEEKKEKVDTFRMATDGNGNASRTWKPDKEGEYLITLKATDGKGNTIETSTRLYVYGSGTVSFRPTNNESLDLVVPKNSLSVGEEGSFVIKSPYARGKALITLERGSIFSYKIVDVNQSLLNQTFVAEERHAPTVYASVLLLSPDPEIKYGQVQYQVDTKEKELDITVKSDKNNYLPGEKVTLTVETRNSKGALVPAEVSLAVADLSVLALKGNPKKNPLAFFYGGLPLAVTTASNIKNVLHEAEIPTGTKGGGGAGLEASELAKKKRGVFKDTAFWRGALVTSSQGVASVTFTLPDNLTTWQAEAVGITQDTKVGSGYSEMVARKQLSLVPLYPRFILPGDEFMLGAKVVNDTDETQRLTVSADGTTLKLKTSQALTIGAHKTETVYFKTTAPRDMESGTHSFVLSAKNSAYEDTVESQIPVGTTAFYENTATASFTQADSAKEYIYIPDSVLPDRGGLSITAQSSLVSYLGDAFRYLADYPYGCSEQLASKLAALAVLKKAGLSAGTVTFEGQKYSADDLVKIGLQKIYANQHAEGGFVYYPGMRGASYSLTLSVLESLEEIRGAGYAVDQSVINRAGTYVYQSIRYPKPNYQLDDSSVVLGIEVLTRIGGTWNQGEYRSYFENRISSFAARAGFVIDSIPNSVLSSLALTMSRGYAASRKDFVFGVLENRLSLDTRGAFIPTGVNRLYDYYETPEKNTALYLKALVAQKRDNPIIDNVLRWLIAQQKRDGGWTTTNTTVAVMDALEDYVSWKQENDARYSLTVTLGGETVSVGDLSKENKILKGFVPLASIKKNSFVPLEFTKKDTADVKGTLYYSAQLTYALPTEKLPPRDEGIAVSRSLYAQEDADLKNPVTSAKQGDVLRGRITITVPKDRSLVSIEDYIPAGMELVNFNLATENADAIKDQVRDLGALRKGFVANILSLGGLSELPDDMYGPTVGKYELYPDAEEVHDDRLFLFKERLLPGVYTYDYYVRALIPGTYQYLPAVAQQMYAPEIFGRSAGGMFTIGE